ncbi:hypothetical protein CO612_00660 [Lysobacteraceae bacterium NML71-0210]|nr:hypothetical protein CO612_00660 [Xanthomonadaceae bacterium NML71-0210]
MRTGKFSFTTVYLTGKATIEATSWLKKFLAIFLDYFMKVSQESIAIGITESHAYSGHPHDTQAARD